MAIIRRGYSDDFVLKNGNAGIGSADPQTSLDVAGAIKSQSFKSVGISSFSGYEGFLNSDQQIDESISINGGASLSGEIIVGTGVTATVGSAATGSQGAIESLKVYNTFNPPLGGTNDRPIKAKPGQLYYNQDFKTIEFWDGNNWRQVDYTTRSGRAISGGGANPANIDLIEYFSIATGGNATNFGTLTAVRNQVGGTSDGKRGIFAGGQPNTDIIDYITIASTGDAIDFGNLSVTRQDVQAVASSTRGVFGGGFTPSPNVAKNEIDYVEIQTTGNALDFGDLGSSGGWGMSAVQSPVRGVFLGGNPNRLQVIEFITISSLGNAVRFGDCDNNTGNYSSGASNSVRGIFAGGTPAGKISYVTIASEGNTSVFGDLTTDLSQAAAAATQTRFTYFGGRGSASPNPNLSQISYVTIATLGDHQEFGELSISNRLQAGFSDSHGGLGGF